MKKFSVKLLTAALLSIPSVFSGDIEQFNPFLPSLGDKSFEFEGGHSNSTSIQVVYDLEKSNFFGQLLEAGQKDRAINTIRELALINKFMDASLPELFFNELKKDNEALKEFADRLIFAQFANNSSRLYALTHQDTNGAHRVYTNEFNDQNIRDINNPLLERVSDVDLLRISSCLRAEILSKALPAHVGTDFFDTLRILAPVEMGDLMLSAAMKLQRGVS